ncbi:hypothetical protein INR49_028170 [Caranx melampygus]|nr:hypothetical protein INR49_028170 [Caranx melampygus]
MMMTMMTMMMTMTTMMMMMMTMTSMVLITRALCAHIVNSVSIVTAVINVPVKRETSLNTVMSARCAASATCVLLVTLCVSLEDLLMK